MSRRSHYHKNKDVVSKRGNSRSTSHEAPWSPFKKKEKKEKITIRKKNEIRDLPSMKQDQVASILNSLKPHKDLPEQSIVISEKKGIILQKEGRNKVVTYEPKASEEHVYADQPKNTLYDIHTHGEWSVHSAPDVLVLLKYPSVKESILMTPKEHPNASNLIYVLSRTNLPARNKIIPVNDIDFDKKFLKEYNDAMKAGKKHIRSKKNAVDWFDDPTLREGSLEDKEMAAELKGLELLGKQYGFKISAAVRDTTLIDEELIM
ncbi:hypothetical protein LCGC14_0175880 [marine sediment metagenome]|uniref:Uncharacterized protein n=1 Tax=marine sediment metagenome TaxID=412755 RepID=A0A0F9UVF1_9ZZZZ